ncbi:MAG: 2-oxoacid:acceptor oxidoreductase subunit alpha [Patescibacteria group bacterium]
MSSTPFTFSMGGEAGYGIASTGLSFSKLAMRSGYYCYTYLEYPSLIRGGHNVFLTSFSRLPVGGTYRTIDFLVALNHETVDRHLDNIAKGGILMHDGTQKLSLPAGKSVHYIDIPFMGIARKLGAILLRDMVAMGASVAMLGGSFDVLEEIIREEFVKKGEDAIRTNIDAAKAGFVHATKHFSPAIRKILTPIKSDKKMIINGNEATAFGGLAAGLQFAAIYPMTPTSNILHVLAPLQEEYGLVYKQPEDEISAINMAIGASFAGARSMVATSGGGFCLMTEGLGLAGITETPIVIIEGMRGAPATGLPTWTEQGDLQFMLHAHQGEFPRIVLAPGDAEEAFHLTMEAFNLADRYQTPVIVLIDKLICESFQSFKPFEYDKYKIDQGKITYDVIKNYQRYGLSADGISLRAPAGTGNHVMENSDEHDTFGFSSEEIEVRNAQMKKRMTKLLTCAKRESTEPKLYGPAKADLTVVGWGSTKGAVLEALKELPKVNFLHLNWISPFPSEAVAKHLKKAKKLVNIELNYSGQLGNIIAEKTGIRIEDNILKCDGRPFYPEELVSELKKRL